MKEDRSKNVSQLKRGREFENRIMSSIRKQFPNAPVFHNPNIKSQKGFDGFILKAKKFLTLEIKESGKEDFYVSRISKREHEYLDKVDREGGESLIITRLKEAGKYIHYVVKWRNIKKETKISGPTLRKQGGASFDREKGKKEYSVKQAIYRVLGKKDTVVSKETESKRESTTELKYGIFPKFKSIWEISPDDTPREYAHIKRHKWKTILKEGWKIDVDKDGLSEKVGIEYKRWSNPYNSSFGSHENWERLTGQWGRQLAKDHNKKLAKREVARKYRSMRNDPYHGLYNEDGVQYKIVSHEKPEHYSTVIATIKSLREHGMKAISGQPVDGRKRKGSRPDIILTRVRNGKKENIAVEVQSGDKSRGQYRKRFGNDYDKIVILKRRYMPNPTSSEYDKVKKEIWSEIVEQVGM